MLKGEFIIKVYGYRMETMGRNTARAQEEL